VPTSPKRGDCLTKTQDFGLIKKSGACSVKTATQEFVQAFFSKTFSNSGCNSDGPKVAKLLVG